MIFQSRYIQKDHVFNGLTAFCKINSYSNIYIYCGNGIVKVRKLSNLALGAWLTETFLYPSVWCLGIIWLLSLRKCTPRCIYGCALLVQYSNGYFIAHFRDAWHTTKTIYPCTQTFIIVISTLFNYTLSCFTCIHFRSVICNIM